jgi:hypothetical protein
VPRQLLVTGWPRECVLDVGMLLNEHPAVLLGIERFSGLRHLTDPFLFAPERLVRPLSAETKVRGELFYTRLAERAASAPPDIVGDVDISHVQALDRLELRLGNNRALVVVGHPGSGELDHWRSVIRLTRETERTRFGARVFVLLWEPFVAGEERWLRALLGFVGVPPTERLNAAYARLCDTATPGVVSTGAGVEDGALLSWLQDRAAAELDAYALDGRPLPPVLPSAPLTEAELADRSAERRQLQAEHAGGSQWPPEAPALTGRYRELTAEAHSRGRRLMTELIMSGTRLPLSTLSVNFISASQQRHEIARTELLDQLASHLSRFCKVRVFAGEPRAVPPGVELQLGTVDDTVLRGEHDVVVYPADLPDTERFLTARRAVMLLDGFEEPLCETVLTNVGAAREVIATSAWLCTLAREHGATAVQVPLGLDRAMFAQGPPADRRGLHVTAVAHTAGWMDCETLSEALVHVREVRPEVSVTLFGNVPADGVTRFVARPPLKLIANVIRSSSVHLVSAREEGFGYVGAGALACGAALVSTKTKGASEYAIDGRTALLVTPGDASALAEAVLELLADAEQRGRLAAAGAALVRRLLPPWVEVARRFVLAIDAEQ